MGNLVKKFIAWWRRLRGVSVDQTPAVEVKSDFSESAGLAPYQYREHRTYTKRDEGLWRGLGHAKFKRQRIARREQRQAQNG